MNITIKNNFEFHVAVQRCIKCQNEDEDEGTIEAGKEMVLKASATSRFQCFHPLFVAEQYAGMCVMNVYNPEPQDYNIKKDKEVIVPPFYSIEA